MLSLSPQRSPKILIPRPVKKYSTDFSLLDLTEPCEEVELFSPTKLIGKRGSNTEVVPEKEKAQQVETRSCNPHSWDPEFVAMGKYQEWDISIDDLEMDL